MLMELQGEARTLRRDRLREGLDHVMTFTLNRYWLAGLRAGSAEVSGD